MKRRTWPELAYNSQCKTHLPGSKIKAFCGHRFAASWRTVAIATDPDKVTCLRCLIRAARGLPPA